MHKNEESLQEISRAENKTGKDLPDSSCEQAYVKHGKIDGDERLPSQFGPGLSCLATRHTREPGQGFYRR